MQVAFRHFSDFKKVCRFKEYRFLPGLFLRIFDYTAAVYDENRKVHFIRKRDLLGMRGKYEFPSLCRSFALEQIRIKPKRSCVINWNGLEGAGWLKAKEKKAIEALVVPLINPQEKSRTFKKKSTHLPCTVSLVKEEGKELPDVFLKLRKSQEGIAGKGGQRVIKFAYDLRRGVKVVRKQISPHEMEPLLLMRGATGFSKTIAIDKEQNILFEKLYRGGNLRQLSCESTEQILEVFQQISRALRTMHFKRTSDGRRAFHCDLKPKNIFWRFGRKKGLQVVLADLGLANLREGKIGGTPRWMSPEYAREWMRLDRTRKGTPGFNEAHGQGMDCWALGLVMASLLVKGGLSCLKYYGTKEQVLTKVSHIQQKTIDAEVLKWTSKEKDPVRVQLWEIVKKLVKVDPKERISAADAYLRCATIASK